MKSLKFSKPIALALSLVALSATTSLAENNRISKADSIAAVLKARKALDWPNLKAFPSRNAAVMAKEKAPGDRIVFMGNSITEQWDQNRPDFFDDNKFIGRGIGGQVTGQMLLRFKQDVVALDADVVVILAGINDLAGNQGDATPEMAFNNISSMCEVAEANDIKVILCSVLPAKICRWAPAYKPDVTVPQLNALLAEYAKERKITYVNFFDAMVDRDNPDNKNGMIKEYTTDDVHVTQKGYEVMEKMILSTLKREKIK